MRPSARSHGFTLIELSVVLVIIGLVVGSILVGRELIKAAELRGDIGAVEKLDAAVTVFRLKYNCLPGDCPHATQFFEGADNGNGSGLIDTRTGGTLAMGAPIGMPQGASRQSNLAEFFRLEVAFALDHLARAGLGGLASFNPNDRSLVADDVMPRLPSGGRFMVRAECASRELPGMSETWYFCVTTGKHTFRLGTTDSSSCYAGGRCIMTEPIYSPHDALYIDGKLDDGMATTGRVTAAGANGNLAPGGEANAGYAFESISYVYWDDVCNAARAVEAGLDPVNCQYDLDIGDDKVGLFIRSNF
jgi:prepilin-type N-terminal cleavage/methylation domain-containing protein